MGLGVAAVTFMLMCLGAAFRLGVEPILAANRDRSIQRQILASGVSSTSDAAGPVVLRGRVAPNQLVPVGGGGMALDERESLRLDSSWAGSSSTTRSLSFF